MPFHDPHTTIQIMVVTSFEPSAIPPVRHPNPQPSTLNKPYTSSQTPNTKHQTPNPTIQNPTPKHQTPTPRHDGHTDEQFWWHCLCNTRSGCSVFARLAFYAVYVEGTRRAFAYRYGTIWNRNREPGPESGPGFGHFQMQDNLSCSCLGETTYIFKPESVPLSEWEAAVQQE
jgi:hypothetical protein